MKRLSIGFAIKGLVLIAMLQSSCDWQVKPSSTHSSNVNSQNAQTTADNDLLKQVEIFASSDTTASSNAWKTLENYGRQNLIEDLTRLYATASLDDRRRVLIAFTFCKLNHEYADNREIVLSALTKESPFKYFYGDWAVSLVRRLMIQGDKDLIDHLLGAAEWSDGAMSEELATAYSQAVATEPQAFLQALSSQNENTRRIVYLMLQDNSLTKDEIERVKVFLKSIPPSSKLHETAQETIKALQGKGSSSRR